MIRSQLDYFPGCNIVLRPDGDEPGSFRERGEVYLMGASVHFSAVDHLAIQRDYFKIAYLFLRILNYQKTWGWIGIEGHLRMNQFLPFTNNQRFPECRFYGPKIQKFIGGTGPGTSVKINCKINRKSIS